MLELYNKKIAGKGSEIYKIKVTLDRSSGEMFFRFRKKHGFFHAWSDKIWVPNAINGRRIPTTNEVPYKVFADERLGLPKNWFDHYIHAAVRSFIMNQYDIDMAEAEQLLKKSSHGTIIGHWGL